MMKRIAILIVAAVTAAAVPGETGRIHAAEPAGAGAVTVTVNYQGKGTVDAGHRVWVWLFDSPDIGPASMPVAQMSIDKNGATASFDVSQERVWIVVAFDDMGVMSGDGPPAPGSPIGIYSTSGGAPDAVTAGAKGNVTLTFDDSMRMP